MGLLLLGIAWTACTAQGFLTKSNGWTIGTLALTIGFWIRLRYIYSVFAGGMLCPATVISRQPLLVCVLTDLASSAETTRPVLKVFAPGDCKTFLHLGTRLAAVSTYSGVTPAGHWDDCHPQLAINANDEPALQQRLLESIGQDEWDSLTRACEQIPSPPKSGLYPLRATPCA